MYWKKVQPFQVTTFWGFMLFTSEMLGAKDAG
jgi:hypothetical protein